LNVPAAQPQEPDKIATALRLGWYFTELRGRHDDAVYMPPRPLVFKQEGSLSLGDERTRGDQASEVAAVVAAAARTLEADPDLATLGATVKLLPSSTTAGIALAVIADRLRTSARASARREAHEDLADLLGRWDEAIQTTLAVTSPRLSAAYRLGRALADVRWSLHPRILDPNLHGWRFLLGDWRHTMLARLIDRLAPYFNDKLTPHALKESVSRWAKVVAVDELIRADDAAAKLAQQSEIWHDLLLGERSASDLIDHDVETLVRQPSVLLLAMKPFRLEIGLLFVSFLGLIAASWLVFTNTPAARPGTGMGSQSAAASLVMVAQNIGGRDAAAAVIAVLSLFGVTLAGLSARAKASLQDLVVGIRESIDKILAAEAATVLPATPWPLPKTGSNFYLRYASLPQRARALLLDWLVLLAGDLVVIFATWLLLSFFAVGMLALRNTVLVVSLLMGSLYFAGWPAGRGRGIGMWTQRMRILDAIEGRLPDTRQTLRRALAVLVPFELLAVAFWLLPLGLAPIPLLVALGWLVVLCYTVATGQDHRGWHDVWAGTVVVAATHPDYDFATLGPELPAETAKTAKTARTPETARTAETAETAAEQSPPAPEVEESGAQARAEEEVVPTAAARKG